MEVTRPGALSKDAHMHRVSESRVQVKEFVHAEAFPWLSHNEGTSAPEDKKFADVIFRICTR